jgi:RNA polymerase sigma-70 factor (sigma-E family)
MRDSERSDAIAFCERVRPKLVGALTLYCGDVATAEEHAHEALIRVWQNWAGVRTMNSPEAWVMRVAINGANSLWRRRMAERRALARVAGRRAAYAAPTGGDADAVALRRAVAALPRRQRMVVVLRFYLDLSVEETALWMDCTTGTVKVHTHRALAALRTLPSLREEETLP